MTGFIIPFSVHHDGKLSSAQEPEAEIMEEFYFLVCSPHHFQPAFLNYQGTCVQRRLPTMSGAFLYQALIKLYPYLPHLPAGQLGGGIFSNEFSTFMITLIYIKF